MPCLLPAFNLYIKSSVHSNYFRLLSINTCYVFFRNTNKIVDISLAMIIFVVYKQIYRGVIVKVYAYLRVSGNGSGSRHWL